MLVTLVHCLSLTGQVEFDSIKICHDANKALRQVTVKEYVVNIQNGQLSSFYSLDGIVSYNGADRKLTLKDINMADKKLDSVSFQLTANGELEVVNRGKSIRLKEVRSVATDTSIGIDMPSVSFPVTFTQRTLEKIWVSVGSKFVIIKLHESSKGNMWDISIATNSKQNALLLAQSSGKDYFLQIHDDSNKVGITLQSDKDNGIFNKLMGERHREKNFYSHDSEHTLLYSQKGILKKNKWKEPLRCD